MNSVVTALAEAFKSLVSPKMLALVLWPMLIAVLLWVGVAAFFWGGWIAGLTELIRSTSVELWLAEGFLAAASHYLIAIILVLLVPAVYVTALAVTAVFAMPVMVNHVAARSYPDLGRKRGGSALGSVGNSVFAIVVYCVGWVLSLPLGLFSPFAMIFPSS